MSTKYLPYLLCPFIIFHLISTSGQSPLKLEEPKSGKVDIGKMDLEKIGSGKVNPENYGLGSVIKGNDELNSDIQSGVIAKPIPLHSNKACPQVEKVTDLYGYVKSPYYPNNYPDGVECIYTITVPEGNTVKLVLYDLHMFAGCCDFLYIYNGSEMKRKHLISRENGSGNFSSDAKEPFKITYTTSDTNIMKIKFTTDPEHHERGFYARYDAIPGSKDDPESTACPEENHNGESGVIVSPKWPNHYHPQALCRYKISLPDGKKIIFTINFFDTEENWDHLNIYDGSSSSATKMATLSGIIKPGETYTTSGTNAFLAFTSNPTIERQGYSIRYQAIPK